MKAINPIIRSTFRKDLVRSASIGLLETAQTTFFLLILVRELHAGPTAKSLASIGANFGFLLCPFIVYAVEKFQWRPSSTVGHLSLGATFALLIATLFPSLASVVGCALIAPALLTASVPLITQIYQSNYPEKIRGKMYSRTNVVRLVVTMLFAFIVGHLLSGKLYLYPSLFAVYTLAAIVVSWACYKLPSSPLVSDGQTKLFQGFAFIASDALFRRTLISWALFGFGNLMMVPLRVEYLGNPRYGINISEFEISLLVAVVPNLARLLVSPIWGYLFDHVNFFLIRILGSLGFLFGLITFFLSNSLFGLYAGAIIFGASTAGGDVLWSLWVTKIAPEKRVADYMSVHVFFTGIRGVIAPLVSFQLLAIYSIQPIACISSVFIFCGCLVLLPDLIHKRALTREDTEVDEIL